MAKLARAGTTSVIAAAATAGVLLALGSSASGNAASGSAPVPRNFVRRVDNPWFPLIPGTTFVYRGVKDGKASRDVYSVTFATKRIQGVLCTAVRDRLFLAGRLGERTTDWYAQDRRGNVWYFGESTAELDRAGRVTSTEGTWQAGRNGAQAGIYITGTPQATISVPYVTSHNALLTKEWTALEPGTLDHKYYVRGIGEAKEVAIKGPTERAELVSVRRP
jgi:hypothetical protein